MKKKTSKIIASPAPPSKHISSRALDWSICLLAVTLFFTIAAFKAYDEVRTKLGDEPLTEHSPYRCNEASMFDIINGSITRYGFFKPEYNYYCVYLNNRSISAILRTDYHEVAHALVNYDYGHFCNISKVIE